MSPLNTTDASASPVEAAAGLGEFIRVLFSLVLLVLPFAPATAAGEERIYKPGSIIAAAPDTEESSIGRLVEIDPATMSVDTLVEGGFLQFPRGVAFAPDGAILVPDLGGSLDRVIRVDPTDGTQSVLAELPFANSREPTQLGVSNPAVVGEILVVPVTDTPTSPCRYCVFTVDLGSGQVDILTQDGFLSAPQSALAESADALVTGPAVVRVGLSNGSQSIPSEYSLDGLAFAIDMTWTESGDLVVLTDVGLIRFDPALGPTVFSNVSTGTSSKSVGSLDVLPDGRFVVAATGSILLVDPETGAFVPIPDTGLSSSFANQGIAVTPVPEAETLLALQIAIVVLLCLKSTSRRPPIRRGPYPPSPFPLVESSGSSRGSPGRLLL